jgi:hypothetical protein
MDAYNKTPIRILLTLSRLAMFLAVLIFGFQPNVTVQAADQVVMNTNNSGAGSLRQAIANVGSGKPITFNLNSYPATITLSSELAISENLTIIGPGAAQLTISGNRGIYDGGIENGFVLIINNSTITAIEATIGGGQGGYIDNFDADATTDHKNTIIYGNTAFGDKMAKMKPASKSTFSYFRR